MGIWLATTSAATIQTRRVEERSHPLTTGIQLVAIFPDPATFESDEPFRVEARRPSGETVTLLEIKRYEPMWREKYFLRGALFLPEGTEIVLSRPAVWLDFYAVSTAAE